MTRHVITRKAKDLEFNIEIPKYFAEEHRIPLLKEIEVVIFETKNLKVFHKEHKKEKPYRHKSMLGNALIYGV